MAKRCFVKKDSNPPICGVHHVLLVQKQVPDELIAAGHTSYSFFVCPVSGTVLNDVEYIGNVDPVQIFARGWTKPFDFQCDACGKNYNYMFDDVRLFPKAHPPETL